MENNRIKFIACATVLEEIQPFLTPNIEPVSIESGLHLRPEKLKEALQDVINEVTDKTETIILGFGLCSMAVVGLKAEKNLLIVPRVDDCIAMCLGSQEAYKAQLKKEAGTYFLSRGWIDAGISIMEEFKEMEEKYGKKRAETIKNAMLKNYSRLAFIDMGSPDRERYQKVCRHAAKELKLRYEGIKGTTKLLKQMLNGPWDDSFVVAPPGHTITLEDFRLFPST